VRCVAASLLAADGRLPLAAALLELERAPGASPTTDVDARVTQPDRDDDLPLLETLCRVRYRAVECDSNLNVAKLCSYIWLTAT
jgi:hypothetical protein